MPDAKERGFISKVIGGTLIREVVGHDPVEFVEAFAQNYTKGGYIPDRERERLTNTFERAAGEDNGRDGTVR